MRALTACLLALCLALSASARPNLNGNRQQQLRDSLAGLKSQHGRRLSQLPACPPSSAVSQAQGSQSASASAVAGPCTASTQQSATGAGSTVQGVSQVGQKIDACARGPADSAACQTLTTADRVTDCSDIAPAPVDGAPFYNCTQQAGFGKCEVDFIFLGGYCLRSCGRCADGCTDVPPSAGVACAQATCNSTQVAAGPNCLKTCGRCSTAAFPAGWVPVALPPPGAGAAAQAAAEAKAKAEAAAGGAKAGAKAEAGAGKR